MSDQGQTWQVILDNAKLRRKLLWLRAKEKGDLRSARDLERLEPQQACWRAGANAKAARHGDPRARSLAYGEMFVDLFRRSLHDD